MKARAKAEKKFSADQMMRNTALSLIRDFQRNLVDPTYCSDLSLVIRSGEIRKIREATLAADVKAPDSYRFKCDYQVSSIFKRYRFEQDLFSDDELDEMAIAKFVETQDRICCHTSDRYGETTWRVIKYAQIYIAKVLGEYSDEEHRALSKFGRRASVGIPARHACEAARWELPLSGSKAQIDWFDSEMSHVDSVQEYWIRQLDSDPNRSIYQEVDYLKLTLVPKTFKARRVIMPNTTIGSYMSYGLGTMIRRRLKRIGYNISDLQERHKSYARSASIHEQWVTADLSSASDTISDELVKLLVPRDWYEIFTACRIPKVKLPDGTVIDSFTHCTMGVGYTFPLQTLVFLSLLKAIEFDIAPSKFDKRLISVYGDDLIYSRRMHDTVAHVFDQLGFILNVDKTFSEGHFRESCGGDYHCGVDVRPFQPQNGSATVDRIVYEATLYKFVNTLLTRWDECEITGTLTYLYSELEAVSGAIKLVPHDFPDDSGIKTSLPLGSDNLLSKFATAKPKLVGSGAYRFSYLRFLPDVRKENRHDPYLWLRLRGVVGDLPDFHGNPTDNRSAGSNLQRRIIDLCGGEPGEPILLAKWERPESYVRSKLTGRRLRRLATFVTVSNTGRYSRQSGMSCFAMP